MKLQTPDHLVAMLKSLTLAPKERLELNRKLGNMARQYFRSQIREQRDVMTGKAYLPRKRGKVDGWTGERYTHQTIDYERTREMKKKRARLMFTGLSRDMRAYSDDAGFRVGLGGLSGHIGMIHNEGRSVEFSYRMHGFFNTKTARWEGGQKQTGFYKMPARPFIGWTPELVKRLELEIINNMEVKT
jgi:hypothetical protein